MTTPKGLFVRSAMLAALSLASGVAASLAVAQDNDGEDEAVRRGQEKYQHTCAPCHGRGPGDDGRPALPGTAALEIKYRGRIPAVLEDRSDLTYDVLKAFVRNGSWSMPPFRPTEVTDEQLRDIAAYLAAPRR